MASRPSNPNPVNVQQRWPPEERSWLKAEARRIGVTETELLLAFVRREEHRGGEIPVPLDDYLPLPSPRSARGRRLRAERRATEAAVRAKAPPPEPRQPKKLGRPRRTDRA